MSRTLRRRDRSGSIVVLALFLMVIMLSIVALAVDIGYLQVASSELQRSADAAAIAATWELLNAQGPQAGMTPSSMAAIQSAAGQYAGLNTVTKAAPALGYGDCRIGELGTPFNKTAPLTFNNPLAYNAVNVRVRRDAQQNGQIGLFFSKVMGRDTSSLSAEATAAFLNNFAGFRAPADGGNLDLLPFTIDKPTWDGLMNGATSRDEYSFDPQTNTVTCGPDGIPEVNLYPEGTGSPGNRGTVDIGNSNNSTADVGRQIREGVSADDLSYHGGKLELDPVSKSLSLNGDTGISAGIKDDLTSIVGKPRVIPIFTTVAGPGNNAQYTIVGFAGIRVMKVKLTGSSNTSKKVVIQPSRVVSPGAIPATWSDVSSNYVYSPVWLVK